MNSHIEVQGNGPYFPPRLLAGPYAGVTTSEVCIVVQGQFMNFITVDSYVKKDKDPKHYVKPNEGNHRWQNRLTSDQSNLNLTISPPGSVMHQERNDCLSKSEEATKAVEKSTNEALTLGGVRARVTSLVTLPYDKEEARRSREQIDQKGFLIICSWYRLQNYHWGSDDGVTPGDVSNPSLPSVLQPSGLTCCSQGFNVLIPSQIVAGTPKVFHWEWNATDVGLGLYGAFVAMLISPPDPPDTFTCRSLGLGGDAVPQITESFALEKVPSWLGPESSGDVLLVAKSQGVNFLALNDLKLISQSKTFNVSSNSTGTNNPTAISSTSSSISTLTSLLSASSTPANDDRRIGRDWSHHNTAPIVGGVVGAVAFIGLGLAIVFYRRLRYQRKINHFHKEHMPLQQRPPSSFTTTSTLLPRTTESERPSPHSTLKRRSENPVALDGSVTTTMPREANAVECYIRGVKSFGKEEKTDYRRKRRPLPQDQRGSNH
ncbi:hypothetical protein L218DRAFT_1027605 [Marasmius fiardii PR-910]|nr:hypothetical protein L218DRAFT_1027605 [Marasmius fiardii PR-910]